MHWVCVLQRPISFPDALFAERLSLPCDTQRTSLEQEDDAASEAADRQTSRDPQQGREEGSRTVLGWRLWVRLAIDKWWFGEDEVKGRACDDNDNDNVGKNPTRHQLGSERLVRVVGRLARFFYWCDIW